MKAVIDIVLLIIIALCTWNGYKRGLVGGFAGILAIIVALLGGSLLSSAYSQEVVPALEPFVDGYVDSQKNRQLILDNMGYGDSDLSLADILEQDSSLKYDYAYEAMLSVGVYSGQAVKLADKAVTRSNELELTMPEAVISIICETATYVIGLALAFLLILIFLVAVANFGNLSLRLPGMENLDELGGCVIGFVKGFLYCILFCWLLSFLGIIIGKTTMAHTTLGRFFLAFSWLTDALM
ncbi:MAG: CvpA family protein [Eubacteriales bacterium]|nr:CvpA family protein [Eubacteriales bacterium]